MPVVREAHQAGCDSMYALQARLNLRPRCKLGRVDATASDIPHLRPVPSA